MAFRPTNDWGPIDEEIFTEWSHFKVDNTFNKVFNNHNPHSDPTSIITNFKEDGSDNFGFSSDEIGARLSVKSSSNKKSNSTHLDNKLVK